MNEIDAMSAVSGRDQNEIKRYIDSFNHIHLKDFRKALLKSINNIEDIDDNSLKRNLRATLFSMVIIEGRFYPSEMIPIIALLPALGDEALKHSQLVEKFMKEDKNG